MSSNSASHLPPLHLEQSARMGNQVSSARTFAVGAFLANFGTQIYGMVTSPNMKEVADAVSRNRSIHISPLLNICRRIILRSRLIRCSSGRSSRDK